MFPENGGHGCEIEGKQDHFLEGLIGLRHDDINFMKFVFDMITHFRPKRRRPFLALFLEHNRRFEDFERLSLEPSSWSAEGSRVPVYQARADYLESLLPLLNTVDILQHRQHVEQQVQQIQADIEREKKRDFMDD